jgi:hypothetical protein
MAPRDRVGSGRVGLQRMGGVGGGRSFIVGKGWPGISWGEHELWRWPRCSVLQ